MSDILERLRLSNGVMLDAEREECAAEIERLRNALEDCQNLDEAPDLRAEIERLRASERSAWNAAVQRDEEIERLREMLQKCMDKWIPFREVEFRRAVDKALGDD